MKIKTAIIAILLMGTGTVALAQNDMQGMNSGTGKGAAADGYMKAMVTMHDSM